MAAYSALRPLDVEIYFELVFDDGWRDDVPAAIGAVAAIGGRVKLRCGGAFVPIDRADRRSWWRACRDAGVPFKATAGLHHPMRRGEEHGFLNLLAAATAPLDAHRGRCSPRRTARRSSSRRRAARLFASFGSCSWREPVEGLQELGMLR